ncbi:DUF5989 family protein [Candidatus Njordibacter sp. Uisw_039]|uniref:DUF5989 family protein n=1 Tax=Candidatus Njordibacter sp. Uisw_039 TaxID=3230972 RepID=UPI003D593DFC
MNFGLKNESLQLIGSSADPVNLHPTLSITNSEVVMSFSFIKELWLFLRERKKLWLAPVIFVIVLIGSLLIAVQGSVMAPFIYTLF